MIAGKNCHPSLAATSVSSIMCSLCTPEHTFKNCLTIISLKYMIFSQYGKVSDSLTASAHTLACNEARRGKKKKKQA